MASPALRLRVLLGQCQPVVPAVGASTVGASVAPPTFENILIEQKGRVGIITFNRPKALNAICDALVEDLIKALDYFEKECAHSVGCLVLTGAGRAFAAGADIKEMKDKTFPQMQAKDKIKPWERLSDCKIPVIAAVNGFAFGGGCEFAMMCDIVWAADTATFGQPEITIGTIPGAGGTQRLTRVAGKSAAMEMCLSGNSISAAEALRLGLVSRVLPLAELLPAVHVLAAKIASMSRPVAIMCKESVNASFETPLTAGIQFERKVFHSTFALSDQKEGMGAFAAKRPATFTHA